MATLTGGQAIVEALLAQGVDTLFGLPGVQNDYFYNALFDRRDRIRVIHTRHEQGAAYMALGYALASNRVGVYNVVPGPGLLNTTAALATAYGCNAPVLCLTGQIQSDQIGRGYGMLHEIPDQLTVLRSLTKWAQRISTPEEAPRLVAEAFSHMLSHRPRPVGLECPPDVLAGAAEVDVPAGSPRIQRPTPDPAAVEEAVRLLGGARHPVIFVGGGAQHAADAVRDLAEMLQAPVVASANGRGILDSRHYLSHTLAAGRQLYAEADVVLAVGTRLLMPLMYWAVEQRPTLVRIDIDPEEHGRIRPADVGLVADSREALETLITHLGQRDTARPSRREEMTAVGAEIDGMLAGLQPQVSFLQAMRRALPEEGIFVDELTQVGYVSRFAFPVYRPRSFISTGYQGTLGWGLPTALGVKVAAPQRPVLAISGDGGFLFGVQELATAVQHGIDIVMVVFNDGAYGNVLRMQRERYDNRVIASELRNPDFVQLARAFGAQGMRATDARELEEAIRTGFATPGPTLIEVPVGEMPSPWSFVYGRTTGAPRERSNRS